MVSDAVEMLEALAVKECCIWHANVQSSLNSAQNLISLVSQQEVGDDEEVGWVPGEEGKFEGYGGDRIYGSSSLATIQRELLDHLESFNGCRTPVKALETDGNGSITASNGMGLVVLQDPDSEHYKRISSSAAVVPLAGMAGIYCIAICPMDATIDYHNVDYRCSSYD